MHLLVDISAHGFGHLAQLAPVAAALRACVPGLRLTVRSALPRAQLDARLGVPFDHVPEARDFGFVMRNAVDIDLPASARAYQAFHERWADKTRAEADWLRARRVDALLSNAAYLPLAGASLAGLPGAGLSSLNWADLFIHYFAAEPWAAPIHEQMLQAYRGARCFLRVSPGLPMTALEQRRDIGPIARLGRPRRTALARRLGIPEQGRWVLLAMGGMEFRLPVERWARVPEFVWLVSKSWGVRRDDVRCFDEAGFDFVDVLASADAVVTKPGYGTFAEAACAGVPILYLERPDWPETPHFAAWLDEHARARVLPRDRLLAGDFLDELQELWQRPAPAVPAPTGIDEAAALLLTALGLR